MAKIIVAGAGHGGLVAAIKLARLGFNVTIFEKAKKEALGLPQCDVFERDTFQYIGFPGPESFRFGKNQLTFIPSGKETAPITLPEPEEEAIIMDRKVLINHLLTLAEKSGVRIIYNSIVIAPLILGSRVVGIKTENDDYYADLVIDACGYNSPIRKALPKFMKVNREIKDFDMIYTYRAYFERNLSAPQPATDFNINLKENGTVGFSWVVTESDRVDVLIGRFSPLTNEQVLEKLREICEENLHIGKKILKGGVFCAIPVCQPLGVLVADGYAAVGDSAFMTYPVKGSGISYAMKAGAMLADAVRDDTDGLYTAETLWEYERRFYKEIGFVASRLAVLKNLLTYFTSDEINDLFVSGIFTTEDFSKIFSNKSESLFGASGRAFIKEKIRLVRENTVLKAKFSDLAVWIGKLAVTETYFPNKYDRKDVAKWVDKYNEFFDSIRKVM